MVLPGVQALFGFQLIAVFNNGFSEKLSHAEQCVHLLALALVAIAGALIMSPASYHRQTNPRAVSADFIRLGGDSFCQRWSRCSSGSGSIST